MIIIKDISDYILVIVKKLYSFIKILNLESFKELQTKFFAGELTEALENLYTEESKQEEPKPSVKQIGTYSSTIDPGVLPVSVDKGLLPLSTDPGALLLTTSTVVLPETTK